jgi:Radical SAM superfamily
VLAICVGLDGVPGTVSDMTSLGPANPSGEKRAGLQSGEIRWWLRRLGRIPRRLYRELRALPVRVLIAQSPYFELFPSARTLGISTSTVCNANCVFCGYQHLAKSKKLLMSDAVFDRILDEMPGSGITDVVLTPTVGDPLVDPKIISRIHHLRRKGAKTISFYTNGIGINAVGAAALAAAGATSIHVSTCGFDRDEFSLLYRSKKYDEVVSGIENLVRAVREQRSKCRVGVSVISESPRDVVLSRPDTQRLLALGVTIHFTPGVDDWFGVVKEDDVPPGLRSQMRQLTPRGGVCAALFGGLQIRPDGSATACGCRDVGEEVELQVGSIFQNGLQTMHARRLEIMERWRSGRVPRMCERCNVYAQPGLGIFYDIATRYQRHDAASSAP